MPEYIIVSAQSPTVVVPDPPEILYTEAGEVFLLESDTYLELEGNVDP